MYYVEMNQDTTPEPKTLCDPGNCLPFLQGRNLLLFDLQTVEQFMIAGLLILQPLSIKTTL